VKLTEEYIQRISELSGIFVENRIEKLRREKYSEDIINFSYEFAKLTTRDETEENFLRNQYIPWIAQEVKSNPEITKDKSKLDIIINWIKQSNYPKISTNESFDSILEKAKNWLGKKNINPTSGERIEGGRVVKTYPNGLRWIRVTNTNWCMNVGEKYGWCFKDQPRAEEFVGLGEIGASTNGYILLNDKEKPVLAIQYNRERGVVEDIQAPFNKPAKPSVLRYGFDLFDTLGGITEIKGHLDNFWKTLQEHPELKQELLAISSVNLGIDVKLNRKLPIIPEERSILKIGQLLHYGIPLTPEEIITVPINLKLKYNIPLSNQETKLLKTSSDLFIAKLWRAIRARNYEKIFTDEDFVGYSHYEFDYNKRAVKLEMEEEEYDKKFSGMDDDSRYYYDLVNSYNYDENVDSDELNYMHYSLNDVNKKLLQNIASILGMRNYDFDVEGNVAKFLQEYTDIKIEGDFLGKVASGREASATKAINDEVKQQQIFKYENGFLVLPFKALYKFVSEHPEDNIKTFNDLKEVSINGEIELEQTYSDSSINIDDEAHTDINNMFNEAFTDFIDRVQSGQLSISQGIIRGNDILNSLGFKEYENIRYHEHPFFGKVLGVKSGSRAIFVTNIDFDNQKYEVKIFDFGNVKSIRKGAKPKKVLQGKIPFDRLSDYVYQHELFEGMEIRKFIREIIGEDFSYLYDKKTFVPPANVVQNVRATIGVVERNKLTDNSGSNEGSGIQKAKSLAAGEPVTHDQLKRMKAFFDNNLEAVRSEITKGKTMYNSGLIQSWNLWGGDVAKRWVEQNISSVQSSNKTSKKIRNPEDGVRTKTLMDPHNTRIHKESYINDKGELIDFSFDEEPEVAQADPTNQDVDFVKLFKKYDASGRFVGGKGFEYWFPPEAEEELNALGIDWYEKTRVENPEHPDFNKLFLVFTYTPKKLD
jgi:hypothetical protein